MLRDALWLSQVFRDTDSKFWCYLVVLCIHLGALSLPFCAWKNAGLLQWITPRLGAAVHPLENTLSFPCTNNVPFANSPKTRHFNTSPVAPKDSYPLNKNTPKDSFCIQPLDHSNISVGVTQLKAEATSTNTLWGDRWSQRANTVQNRET